ncbi:MAG: hypothetical protein CMQ40_03675 [Gammaproteobacteria bacterium]|nr:hypothetical protein [Gammaproteobacteria bacterium]|tara:strand:+ start:434 stop:1303 length:870 start_codon:yes stop_codon:yes gene_type:complete
MRPDWFSDILRVRPIEKKIIVEKASVNYLHWKNESKNGLVFIHGRGANARWWDFIGPAFTSHFDVIAIDLTGSGDSDHRQEYSLSIFTKEILGCISDAGLRNPIIVGHSFGGEIAQFIAYKFEKKIKAVVLVDSDIFSQQRIRYSEKKRNILTVNERHYRSLDEAKRRFKLRPAQPVKNQFILDHLAKTSVKRTVKGYKFKLDQRVFSKLKPELSIPSGSQIIRNLAIPVGFIYGEKSVFFPDKKIKLLKELFKEDFLRSIPNSHHHVFIDEPAMFVTSLNELLEIFQI